MKYIVNIQNDCVPLLHEMAYQAGVGQSDIIEIALYNLVACYLKDKAPKPEIEDAEIVDCTPDR